MDWVNTAVGIVLLALGGISLAVGFAGLAVKVILAIIKDVKRDASLLAEAKADWGDIVKKVLEAIAQSPPYLIAILLGLALIDAGMVMLGVTIQIGDICISIVDGCPADDAGGGGDGGGGGDTPEESPAT